jgi:hypothetical protein
VTYRLAWSEIGAGLLIMVDIFHFSGMLLSNSYCHSDEFFFAVPL